MSRSISSYTSDYVRSLSVPSLPAPSKPTSRQLRCSSTPSVARRLDVW